MDQQIFFLINAHWAAPWLDMPMALASSWDFWWPFLVAGGLALAIFGGFKGRVFLLVAGLSVGITDGIVVDSLKEIVGRPRPHEAVPGVRTLDLAKASPRFLAIAKPLKEEFSVSRLLPPHGNSFPSGHASNNFALATVVTVFWRRRGWLAFFPAALVSYSRIYVGSHWPLDVAVSALIGAGIALLVCAAAQALWRKIAPRFAPSLFFTHPDLFARNPQKLPRTASP